MRRPSYLVRCDNTRRCRVMVVQGVGETNHEVVATIVSESIGKMLTMCDNAQHASDVYTISYDIVMHSELINLHECIGYGDVNIYDDVEAIANRILNECTTYRFNSEENERRF